MHSLSEREKKILSYVNFGYPDIGKILSYSKDTVKWYFSQMFSKKNAENKVQLLFKALRDGDIRKIDLGFWDEKGKYHPDWYIVDLRKE